MIRCVNVKIAFACVSALFVGLVNGELTELPYRGGNVPLYSPIDEGYRHSKLSSDGNTLLFGTAGGNSIDSIVMQALRFDSASGNWTQMGENFMYDSNVFEDSQFGEIEISGDGLTVAVAGWWSDAEAPLHPDESSDGVVGVYAWTGTAWAQKGSILNHNDDYHLSDGIFAVTLNNDGSRVAMSAWQAQSATHNAGNYSMPATWIYEWSAASADWVPMPGSPFLVGEYPGADPHPNTDDTYIRSVEFSGDGTTLAIGVWTKDDDANGRLEVLQQVGGTWQSVYAYDASIANAGSQFGFEMAISDDGSMIVVGARTYPGEAADVHYGLVYSFYKSGNTWIEGPTVDRPTHLCTMFGQGLDLSSDGRVMVASGADIGWAGFDEGTDECFGIWTWTGSDWEIQVNHTSPKMDDQTHGYGGHVSISGDARTLSVADWWAPGLEDGIGNDLTGQGRIHVYEVPSFDDDDDDVTSPAPVTGTAAALVAVAVASVASLI